MRVLIAGGIFRLPLELQRMRESAPEATLAEGLRRRGLEVTTYPLEHFVKIARAQNQDLVHVHHLSRAAVTAALSPWARPLVFTEHRLCQHTSRPHREGAALQVVMRSAAATVCLSDQERRYRAEQFPHTADRLHVIPNGIGFPVADRTLRRWIPGCEFKLLFVGQLIPLKRIDRIFGAIHRDPCLRLRLVYHNDELERVLRGLVTDLRISDRVQFVGQRSGSELAREYADAHALVLPSVEEALPSVVTEALLTGLPIIASDVGGIREQAGNAVILSNPRDDDAIAGAITRAQINYAVLAHCAFEAGPLVKARYSVERMAEEHEKLYTALLAS